MDLAYFNNNNYALLDTDFLVKSHIASDGKDYLFNYLIGIDGYGLCCHEIILKELSEDKNKEYIINHIEQLINAGIITCYSDEDIVNLLETAYGKFALAQYKRILQIGCDKCETGFYKKYYSILENLDYDVDRQDFLMVLNECDRTISNKNSIGEKKTLVLLQALQVSTKKKVYVFCSDDRDARLSISQIDGVRCLSILGLFVALREKGIPSETIKPHYNALCSYIQSIPGNTQIGYKVWVKQKGGVVRRVVDFDTIFEDISKGRLSIRVDGDIVYK